MAQLRLSPPLLVATVVALVFIAGSTLAGWIATTRVGPGVSGNGDAAILSTAFAVARHASLFESEASVSTGAPMTPDQLAGRSASLDADRTELYRHLANLDGQGYDGHATAIRQHADSLAANIQQVENRRPELRSLLSENRNNYRSLRYDTNKKLEAALVTSLDDQFHHMMNGHNQPAATAQPQGGSLSRNDVLRYHHIFNLLDSGHIGVGKLLGGSLTSFPESVQLIREDYDAEAQRMEYSVAYLSEHGGSNLQPDAIPLVEELLAFGGEDGNFWRDLDVRLAMVDAEREQIAANGERLEDLLHGVDLLVADVNRRSAADAASATQAINTWRIIILAIGVTGGLATLVAAGYFGARGNRQ